MFSRIYSTVKGENILKLKLEFFLHAMRLIELEVYVHWKNYCFYELINFFIVFFTIYDIKK